MEPHVESTMGRHLIMEVSYKRRLHDRRWASTQQINVHLPRIGNQDETQRLCDALAIEAIKRLSYRGGSGHHIGFDHDLIAMLSEWNPVSVRNFILNIGCNGDPAILMIHLANRYIALAAFMVEAIRNPNR
jgi:hypothetical protein